MKLTKYEHSCLVIEKAGSTLIVDPGSFTSPMGDIGDVVAVVITHEHPDHWTPEQLNRIVERNPGVRILAPAGVAKAVTDHVLEIVADGDVIEAGPFDLKFFGKDHAVIHSSIPVVDNVGVLVDDELYYGGDSYTIPPVPVGTLATPVGAPWLKIGDVIDYVLAVAPKRSFGVHEAPLSQIGRTMAHGRVQAATEAGGGEFTPLEPGESLEL